LADWKTIMDQADAIYAQLPAESRDAFFELVLYPAKASAIINELYISVAKNRFYAKRGDSRANEFAQRARDLFEQDAKLSAYYNDELAGGKWKHMMDQTHIGYTDWQQPAKNSMPKVEEVTNSFSLIIPPDHNPRSKTLPADVPPDWRGFMETDGYVSIEAEHFTQSVPAGETRWEVVPDLGNTLSAMTIFPVTARRVSPPENSPRLDYNLWLISTGVVEVTLVLSPGLNFHPDRGVRVGVSMDEAEIQILTIVPRGYTAGDGNRDWEESVRTNTRKVSSLHRVSKPGAHTLKVWMLDPAVVLQKVMVNCGGLKPSYLGPPESVRVQRSTKNSNQNN